MPEPPGPGSVLGPGGTFYDLLQLPPTATPQELRQAFRRLSKRYHPDTTSLPPGEAERAFQRLQRAYAVLSDPPSRQRYDAQLARPATSPQPPMAGRPVPPGPVSGAPVSLRRALSGGEWFALLLLAIALLLSLVLGLGVAWARGADLVRWPSWWAELHPAALAMEGATPGGGMVETPSPPTAPLSADAFHVPSP